MSYILDALKKSERERSLDNVPILRTMPARTNGGGWRAAFLVLIAVVIGIAAVAAYTDRDQAVSPGAALLQPVENETPVHRTDSPPPPNGNAAPTSESVSAVMEITPSVLEIPPATGTDFLAGAATETRVGAETDKQITALPQELAHIVVNVISYSTHKDRRFIMVGGRVLKEGDALQAGGIIDSITKDAVIVAYAGRQYRLQP